MIIKVRAIDVGWSYNLNSPCRAVLFGPSAKEKSVPTDSLIQTAVKKRGHFGFMNINDPAYPAYADRVSQWIENALGDHTLVILPEFSFCEDLEKRVERLLSKRKTTCIVIGGSYYRQANGIIESVCPILSWSMPIVHQHKLLPSPHEEGFLDEPPIPTLHVVKNTGFGDMAVVLCSDAIPARFEELKNPLRGRIDLLVVIARNRSSTIPDTLKALSHEMQWTVLYCNGLRTKPSRVISPYKGISKKRPVLKKETTTIDLKSFHVDLASKSKDLHQPTQPKQFRPAPRHWPYKRSGAIDFPTHLKVVAIGSHFDDIWIGCAGSLMLLRECYEAQVVCVSVCSNYPYPYFGLYDLRGQGYAQITEDVANLCNSLGFEFTQIEGPFQDREFCRVDVELQVATNELALQYSDADLIFVPRQDDPHEDHVLTTRAAVNAFRRADMLEYEIKDFRRTPFRPNTLVDLSRKSAMDLVLRGDRVFGAGESFAVKKAALLKHAFTMMVGDAPDVFQPQHTLGRLSFRASQSGKGISYAEAFVAEVVI